MDSDSPSLPSGSTLQVGVNQHRHTTAYPLYLRQSVRSHGNVDAFTPEDIVLDVDRPSVTQPNYSRHNLPGVI